MRWSIIERPVIGSGIRVREILLEQGSTIMVTHDVDHRQRSLQGAQAMKPGRKFVVLQALLGSFIHQVAGGYHQRLGDGIEGDLIEDIVGDAILYLRAGTGIAIGIKDKVGGLQRPGVEISSYLLLIGGDAVEVMGSGKERAEINPVEVSGWVRGWSERSRGIRGILSPGKKNFRQTFCLPHNAHTCGVSGKKKVGTFFKYERDSWWRG